MKMSVQVYNSFPCVGLQIDQGLGDKDTEQGVTILSSQLYFFNYRYVLLKARVFFTEVLLVCLRLVHLT